MPDDDARPRRPDAELTRGDLDDLPLALADLHAATPLGARLVVALPGSIARSDLRDLVVGAGFRFGRVAAAGSCGATATISITRLRTLPDIVGPRMRLLLCGLNPSLYSADARVGFARPGNRFWPALAAVGIDDVDREPRALLSRHGIGMTDVVKRATTAASELTRDEYRDGLARVERLAERHRPGAICFVGLAGWRAAVDRKAVAGWQPTPLGDAPAYVMPSTSGLNAVTPLATLADHLRAALAGR